MEMLRQLTTLGRCRRIGSVSIENGMNSIRADIEQRGFSGVLERFS
jgi:hypothetical protein